MALRVLCHGDFWAAHAYFDGETLAGFVDFESLVFAPSTLDLAQLIGRFGGWGAQEGMLGAYGRLAPPGEGCRSRLPQEMIADLAGEGLWSLRALYGRPASETNPVQQEAHALNLGVLLGCLEGASGKAEKFSS